MRWLIVLQLIRAPAPAPEPDGSRLVIVDRIVINRVRSVSWAFDAWGRPVSTPSEIWWVSYWERCRAVVLPVPMIDRGWAAMSQVVLITPSTAGWCVELKNGLCVSARELVVIDSPFDWEMKHRVVYWPLK